MHGYSCLELILVLAISAILTTAAGMLSVKLINIRILTGQAQQLEMYISRVMSSSTLQHRRLTLSFSRQRLQVFRDVKLISQFVPAKGLILKKHSATDLVSWIEEIYPSGVQNPFTIELIHNKDLCLLTSSLRGRVSSKCFFN